MSYISLPSRFLPDEFDFSEYHRDELNLIKPLMETEGYTNIRFVMGERDSFGPLSRVVLATTPQGNHVKFVYG